MKKTVLVVSLFTAILFITACGGGKGEKKPAAEAQVSAETKISAEMQDFINSFNGKYTSVEAALQKHAAPGIDTKDMGIYDLDEPKVLETNGNCYLIQCKSGMTKRKYNVCWNENKISMIEDKGME